MRVELPASPPEPIHPPAAAPAPAAHRPRRFSPLERWVRIVTAWRIAAPTLAVCAGLLGWALLLREPQGRKALMVMARSSPPVRPTNSSVTAESLAALKAESNARLQTLVHGRKEIPPLLTRLEAQARQLGWLSERSIKPAVQSPFGLTNLTLHPVTIHLVAQQGHSGPVFHRLAAWLDGVPSLERRAEVVNLELRADASGLCSADVKLHFYGVNDHAETSPK